MTQDFSIEIATDPEKIEALQQKIALIKCGGNAMVNEQIKRSIINDIIALKKLGIIPVIVHGGGPVIKDLLNDVGVQSEFIGGHRKTDSRTMGYVEMALTGKVNSEIVSLINKSGFKAVGLSGKDGRIATAQKRMHRLSIDGKTEEVDLGHVGDVAKIDPALVQLLIDHNYIPVMSPVAGGADLDAYNVNADMFAGHLAGALGAASYVALTNVDGLLLDPEDPSTLVEKISIGEVQAEIGNSIRGGMIPKVESAVIALKEGAGSARIVNGTKNHPILRALLTNQPAGTLITIKQ